MSFWYVRGTTLASALLLTGSIAISDGNDSSNTSPVYGVGLPLGYRDWQVVGVAHEAGALNDIRVVLGNDIAMKAYRSATRPFALSS